MTKHKLTNNKADVVIIGGGIVGCASAYYLAQHGVDVLLIERRGIGSGASGRSGGGIRQSARLSEEMPAALESIALFPGLSDELGLDIEYNRGGNLRLVEIHDHARPMQMDLARQQSLGLDVSWLDAAEVKELVPALRDGGVLGASYCPTDGHVNPFRLVTGFYQAALRAGARMLIGHEVSSIQPTDAGQVRLIVGEQTVQTSTVIIAAGGGSLKLCLDLGFDLPLANVCYESMVTEALPPLFPQMFGAATGDLFFRQTRHGSVHFGGGVMEETSLEQTTTKNLQLAVEHITRLVPQLKGVNLLRTWGGIDPNTPDGRPIVDYLNENVILATGFCGHGLAIGPIMGRYLADWIATGHKSDVLAPFGYDRFQGWLRTRWTPSGSFEAGLVLDPTQTALADDEQAKIQNLKSEMETGPRLLIIDPKACTGCRMCEMACSIQNEQMARSTQLHIQVVSTSDDFFMPIMCIHCEEAYCIESCHFDALEFDDNNIIKVIDDNCVLCMLCVEACPYGGITHVEEKETVVKCNLCDGNPACAQYCPTGAIIFGPLDEPTWDGMKEVIVDNLWAREER